MPDMPDVSDASSYVPTETVWIMLLVGFLFAFFGKTFFKAIWFLIGGLIFMTIGIILGFVIGALIGYPVICLAIGALVGFIVGGYMGMSWGKWLICLAAAFTGYYMTSIILPSNFLIAIVVAIVFFIIIYIKFDEVLSVMTAIIGGAVIGSVAAGFAGGNPVVFFAVAIPAAIAGMYVQLEIEKKYPDKTYKGEE